MPGVEDTLKAVSLSMHAENPENPGAFTDVGYGMASMYDVPPEASGPGFFTGQKAMAATPTLPGQQWDASGTTLYNPLPSDPRVERILGEKKYKEKIVVTEVDKLKLELEEMKQQMKLMMNASLAKQAEPEPEQVEPEPIADDTGDSQPESKPTRRRRY